MALAACQGQIETITDITPTTAVVHMKGSCEGTAGKPCSFQVTYTAPGLEPGFAPRHEGIGDTHGEVRFTEKLVGLRPETTYALRFCGMGDDNVTAWTCGDPVSFTTSPAPSGPPAPASPDDGSLPSSSDGSASPAGDGSETSSPQGFAPSMVSGANQAGKVVGWATGHVSWWDGRYSGTHPLSTSRNVQYMQTHEPPKGTGPRSDDPKNQGPNRKQPTQGCDCSSFVRWAYAQAGINAGTFTGDMWTANGKLGANRPTSVSVDDPSDAGTAKISRGWGTTPPGGWRSGDLAFYSVRFMTLDDGTTSDHGHVAIYIGDGKIVQCSGKYGSNQGKPLTKAPGSSSPLTGWVRYDRVSG